MNRRNVILNLAGLLFLLGAQAEAQIRQWCTDGDFVGSYGLLASGSILLAPDARVVGPFGRVGRIVSDGAGRLAVQTTASYNGLVFDEPYGGTYKVSSDCTIIFNLDIPAPVNLPATLAGTLADHEKETLFLLLNPPGTTIQGLARKQSKAWCTPTDLAGSFQFEMSGGITFPAAAQFRRIGRLVADDSGRFTAKTNTSYGGLVVAETLSGTYTVDSLCNVALKYGLPQPDGSTVNFTLTGPLVDGGKGAFLIQREPLGAAIVGTLKLQ